MRVRIEAPAVQGTQLVYVSSDFCGSGFLYINAKSLKVNEEWTEELNKDFEGETISSHHANKVLNLWILAGYPRGEF